MADPSIEIPNRAFFKAAEVCEIAQVQPYVLRTWELEFPSLGVPRPGGGTRIYRRQDVELVLNIKQLVFSEGLTLSGARRRLEGPSAPPPEDVSLESLVAPEVRGKLVELKRGLRSILSILSPELPAGEAAQPAALPESNPAPAGELLPFDPGAQAVTGAKVRRRGRDQASKAPKPRPRQPKRGG